MVLPVPGGPVISTLWPPAAAISSARLAKGWPTTSLMSAAAGGGARRAGGSNGNSSLRLSAAQICSSDFAPCTSTPSTTAACFALFAGSTSFFPEPRSDSAATSGPRMSRSAPLSASSPRNT